MADRQADTDSGLPPSSRGQEAALGAEERDAAQYRAPAAEKALDILEYLATAEVGRTQTQIAAGVGRSLHEVYRIIQLLERRGYIARPASGERAGDGYVLTLKLFSLAHQFPPVATLTVAAAPRMRQLAEVARQSCHLAILSGHEVTVVAQVNSPEPMSYGVALGARFPSQETSSGLVLLAGLTEAERERAVSDVVRHGAGPDAAAALREHLRPVLRDGCDVRPSMVVPGVTNISFPVHGHRGETVAALTVPFLPVGRETPPLDRVKAATGQAARLISTALGHAGAEDRAA